MTWTPKGSLLQAGFTGSGTLAMDNQAAGDLVYVVTVSVDSTSNWISAVSGGGCTWTQVGSEFTGTVNGMAVTQWQGTVTALGAQTATLTVTGGAPTIRAGGREFASSAGSWTADGTPAYLDSADTDTMPSLTPAAAGELYAGFAISNVTAVAGSTAGYSYDVTTQGHGYAYDPDCTSSAQAPVWGNAYLIFGASALFRESGAAPASPSASLLAARPPAALVRSAVY